MLSAREVASKVWEAFSFGQPLSLIRLGDGEALLLGLPETEKFLRERSLPVWCGRGVDVSLNSILETRDLLLDAIERADLVGVYPRYPYRKFVEPCVPKAKACSAEVHCDLHKMGILHALFETCPEVRVVSPWEPTHLREGYPQTKFLWSPTEAESRATGRLHNPFESYMSWDYEDMSAPLTVVGAGPWGKRLTVRAAEAGSLALDIGSCLDGYARRLTRGHMLMEPSLWRSPKKVLDGK